MCKNLPTNYGSNKYKTRFIVSIRAQTLITYMGIFVIFGNFMHIKQTLVNGFLHCQSTLHGIQS